MNDVRNRLGIDSFKEKEKFNSTDVVLNSIINKIIAGEKNWTPEELQYQRNYPQKIEKELVNVQFHVPIQSGYEDIMIIPYNWTISKKRQAKKQLNIRHFLYAADAVALSLYHNININGHICIITDDTESIEIGIYDIGDGVFEAVCLHCISKSEQDRLPIVCDTILRDLDLTGKISQIILARTNPHYINTHNLERVFQRQVLQVSNLNELCSADVFVLKGIISGYIKDVLMLQLIPQAIGVSNADGKMVRIIEANTIIPSRKVDVISITDSELAIRQGNNAIAKQNPVIETLHFQNNEQSQPRLIELTVDIDPKGDCIISAKDMRSGEVAKSSNM